MAAKINPLKLKQDAEKEEKAGRVERAIAIYRQILDDNPRDWNTVNKVGDLYVRLNKTKEASAEYAKVADFYAKDGFLLKAIALWKKIDRIDPAALEPKLNLADLYAKQGLMMEAKGQYQVVVDEFVKRNRMRDAGDVLKKMADIDPGDLKIRSKLADLYTRDGNAAKAIEEHIAIADELNKKGHLAEALQVLEKGLKIDAKSVRLRVELARIHLVQKNWDKAASFLEDALNLAPQDSQILARLGDAYVGSKKLEEAEAIFKRLLELDPKDDDSRVQMGRVYLLQGGFDRAYEEFAPIVDRSLERREGDRAAALLQQIVQKNPGHVKSLLKLADVYRILQKDSAVSATYSQLVEAYVQQGQLEQAASVLETLVSREPSNAQHRTKLEFVRAKMSGGRPPEPPPAAVAVSLEVEEEEFDLRDPAAAPAPAPVPAPVAAPRPAPAAAPRAAAPPPAPARAPEPVPELVVPTIELSGPLSEEDKEFIEEHLAEGKVFRKYGLVDKAADQFDSVVSRFPDNVEARQELREVHREKGELAKAAEQSLALAEIFRLRGDAATAESHRADAARFVPAAVPGASAAAPAAAPVAEPEPAPVAAPAAEAVEEEQDIAFGEEEEDIALGEEEGVSLDVEDQGASEPPQQFIEEEEEAPEPAAEDQGAAEEEAFDLESPLAASPAPAAAPPGPLSDEPELALEETTGAPPPQQPAASAARPSGPAAPSELQKVLDEVESYVALGFVDDARDALRDVQARFPGHPALLRKVEELGISLEDEEQPAPPAPAEEREEFDLGAPTADDRESLELVDEPAPRGVAAPADDALGDMGQLELAEAEAGPEREPEHEQAREREREPEPEAASDQDLFADGGSPAAWSAPSDEADASSPEPLGESMTQPPASDGGIDLGAELGDLFGAQSATGEVDADAPGTDLEAGLADIFKEFKKGVDKQLGKEDYDTRYNLGIAYKEMGLIDEAIAEFQLAAKDENRLLECSSMLGICFMDKGMPKLAVKWFEKGLAAPGRSEDEYAALRYDLAVAHEASGEIEKALSLFTDLYGQDANFRDVATKVRDLRASLR